MPGISYSGAASNGGSLPAGGSLGQVVVNTGSGTGDWEQSPYFYVTQNGHGFTIGALTIVRNNGTIYVAAKADTATDAAVWGAAVADTANTFKLFLPGCLIGSLSGLTVGAQFLDPTTAGAVTTTEPTTVGQVSAPVGYAPSTTTFIFAPLRGSLVQATAYTKQILSHATAVTVADLGYYTMPSDLNGLKIVSAELMFEVAPTGGPVEVTVKNNAGSEVFSTRPKCAASKTNNTLTGGVAAVVNTANATVATGDVWTISGTLADTNSADRGMTLLARFA